MKFCKKVLLVVFLVFGSSSFVLAAAGDGFQFPTLHPIDGSEYNVGWNKFKNYRTDFGHHTADDLVINQDEAVYAIADGTIKRATNDDEVGGIYLIEHTAPSGETVVAVYQHLDFSSFIFSEGDSVTKGDFIGTIANSDDGGTASTNPHLHFGIKKGAYSTQRDSVCYDEVKYDGWIYAGYTSCESQLTTWYDPVEFITSKLDEEKTYNTLYDAVNEDEWKFYRIEAPVDVISVDFRLTNISRDADLYVRTGGVPDYNNYDARPYLGGTDSEICSLSKSPTETKIFYIGVNGYADLPTDYKLRVILRY